MVGPTSVLDKRQVCLVSLMRNVTYAPEFNDPMGPPLNPFRFYQHFCYLLIYYGRGSSPPLPRVRSQQPAWIAGVLLRGHEMQ